MQKRIKLPLTDKDIKELKAGDSVLITGTLLTARDAAHKRLFELIEKGKKLPVDIKGQIIYYVGPAPAKPGHTVGPRVLHQVTEWTNILRLCLTWDLKV